MKSSTVSSQQATVAVIGGTGFEAFGQPEDERDVETPFGPPSHAITFHDVGGTRVAFLTRHGRHHTIPPHAINYRANLWALKSLGIERVIAVSACGSLQSRIVPGSIVVCDQFIDRTHGRADTFFDGPEVFHAPAAEPYCAELREDAAAACRQSGMTVHSQGTVVVINGPRYSSRAESRWYASQGWDIVGMTQYPEVMLARELGLCYTTVAMVTDYDAGLADSHTGASVSHEQVVAVFAQNIEWIQRALVTLLKELRTERTCECAPLKPAPV